MNKDIEQVKGKECNGPHCPHEIAVTHYVLTEEELKFALQETEQRGREEVLNIVKAKHVKAKKAYGSDSWDAGYHDALFDVEKSIVGRTPRT